MSLDEVSKIKPKPQNVMAGDVLDITKINKLPHPIMAELYGGSQYEIETLDLQTGCMRLDVSGQIDRMHFSDVKTLIDIDGDKHDPDEFWVE